MGREEKNSPSSGCLALDVIACWEQLETEGTSLLMEKDLSRVGLARGQTGQADKAEA